MDIEVEYYLSGKGKITIDSDDVAKHGSVKEALRVTLREETGIKCDDLSPGTLLRVCDVKFEEWR